MNNMFIILFTTFVVLSAQITGQIKEQSNKAGFAPNQAKQMAKDRGITNQQIEGESKTSGIDLETTGTEEISSQNTFEIIEIDNVKYIKDGLRYVPIIDNEKITVEPKAETETHLVETITSEKEIILDYFGYQIFRGDPTAFQSSTFGAVDPDYNIGPSDQIIVMLWGESQFRQEFTIDREGYVFVPEVGQVFVNGLNLEALEKKIFQIYSKVYSTLNPATGNPTTFMDISLGNLRPLRIIVMGEVSQPGAYSVSPSTSLYSSLYYFKGPTTSGSLRDIRLIRNGQKIGSIDFYDYLLSGNTPDDLRLQLDDVVFIPPRGKTVSIQGEVNRQGIYELKENEGLKNLLRFAGNLKNSAYMNRAQISSIVPFNKRSEIGMDRMIIDFNLQAAIADKKDTELQDGDELVIFSIEERQKNWVEILGPSVIRPGRYQLNKGMRVIDLINTAEGLLNDVYMDFAHILRFKNDLTTDIISINLTKAFAGDIKNNISLNFMDRLIVYNENRIKNTFSYVYINGPVKNPGPYQLENNKKLSDLIIETGGFNPGITKVLISIARRDDKSFNPIIYNIPSSSSPNKFFEIYQLENKDNELNKFNLKPDDVINIYADPKGRSPESIIISGAIYFPGTYPILHKNEKVTDIIQRAGGILPEAYPMASSFIRDGRTIRLSFEKIIKNPNTKENFKVMPGDTIIILTRPNIVEIAGEVNNPGFFQYRDGLTIKNYIDVAGGLTVNAERREIWVTYPDGTSKQLKQFNILPRVFDGSSINVGRKQDTEPLDKTEFAKEVASIIADFLQIYITLLLLWNTASTA